MQSDITHTSYYAIENDQDKYEITLTFNWFWTFINESGTLENPITDIKIMKKNKVGGGHF